MTHKLEADSIILEYGNKWILSNIYIHCETGRITGLLGRNGQGKTSLIKVIYGILKTDFSSIRVDGTSVFKLYKQPNKITLLPQNNFIPGHLKLKTIFKFSKLNWQDFLDWFPDFETFYHYPIQRLSGGQRRVIEAYMIICAPSKFSLLDEPFTHLMPLQIDKVKELIIHKKPEKGFLITDHMYSHILDVSDKLYLLKGGKSHAIHNKDELVQYGYITSR